MGGSSSINGMIYVRGHPQDFDNWSIQGASSWSFADVLPYFKKWNAVKVGNHLGGKNGPIYVKTAEQKNVLHKVFSDAAIQSGYSFTEDYNGYKQEGIGAAEMTIYKGERWSAAKGYLKNITKQKNICIMTSCLADKLLFLNNKCEGIIFKKQNESFLAKSKKGVILAAGSIGNPCILQRSGIGTPKHIADLGIKPFLELKGVGNNLQDHLELYFQVKCKQPITLFKNTNLISKFKIFLEWYFFKKDWGHQINLKLLAFLKQMSNKSTLTYNITFYL